MSVPVKPMNEAFGQRVPHVAGVAVDEVVLAAVRLVGDPPVAAGAGRLAARLVATGRVAIGHHLLQRRRAQRLGDGGLHGVELAVPGHLLDQGAAAVVREHDEDANQRQQPAPVEDAFEQHLELRQGSASVSPAIVRQGLNHSCPAVSAPMRASRPSDTTRAALNVNSDGISDL